MKSACITGANRGLGFGFVEYLLGQGYQVFAGTRKVTDDLPQRENLIWVQCDVTDDASIDAMFVKIEQVLRHGVGQVAEQEINPETERRSDKSRGGLSLLINNAGVNKDTIPADEKDGVSKMGYLDRSSLLNMFNVNAIGPLLVTQKLLPLLTDPWAFVINISSARASFGDIIPSETANYGYAASKVALNMFTHCSRLELPDNVRIFSVNPGAVHTDMNPGALNEPIERAEVILHIINEWYESFDGAFLTHKGELHIL